MRRQSWILVIAAVLMAAAMPVAAQNHTVQPGDDGWTTPGGGLTYLNLTGWNLSSVFPGGSVVPGTEKVNLKGKPIKQASLGSVDTIVRHTGSHTFSYFGETRTIPVQIVGLSMLSDNDPVGISGYGTYNLEVYLSTATAGTGTMSVTQVNGDGGTFSSSFSVYPVVVFVNTSTGAKTRLDCGAVSGCGSIVLNSTGTGWVHTGGPGNFNPANAGVPALPAGVAFDANGDGTNDTTTIGRSNTFIPGFAATSGFPVAGGIHDHADYSTRHVTKPPQDCLQTRTDTNGTTGSSVKGAHGSAVAQPVPSPCPIIVQPTDPVEQPVGGVN
jgi:hypothetical protein